MSTLVSLIERAADLLDPIDGQHWKTLLAGSWMATDGTGLKVLVPKLPAAHSAQTVECDAEAWLPMGQGAHTLTPAVPAKVPAAHGVQLEAPPSEKAPASQLSQVI